MGSLASSDTGRPAGQEHMHFYNEEFFKEIEVSTSNRHSRTSDKDKTPLMTMIKQGFSRVSATCVAISLFGLAGCSTVDESLYPLKDGWRAGKIKEIGSATKLRRLTAMEDCRITATQAQLQANRFAVISYWSLVPLRGSPSDWITRIVPLDASSTLREGDSIYVNILDCNTPAAIRNE